MGKATGFKEITRQLPTRRPTTERIGDWREIYNPFPQVNVQAQGARCMDCGIPFCHKSCPVNNLIPDWNDLVYRNRWAEAIRRLHATNNFPEFTGRICPAPCEASCVLGINEPPVTIKQIEKSIVDHAWEQGWIVPEPPEHRTGKHVAIVGSGPAGLAAAQQLCRAGHWVTVFEKDDRIGGLLRYGIPNFKMEKSVLDRRLKQMSDEGVKFLPSHPIDDASELQKEFDAVLLTCGAQHPRDLRAEGRDLQGIHYAMDFLPLQNRVNEGDSLETQISAAGKRVVIIGGGDTGADCLGTCHRHGAKSVHQFELLPKPPDTRAASTPWPLWPMQLRVEGAHEEGGVRDWGVSTVKFTGDAEGKVKQLHCVRVGPQPVFQPIPGTEFILDADLVLLAMGFMGPTKSGLIEKLGVDLDARGNVRTDQSYQSSVPGVFAAGDMRRGQSLVVWAIAEGRKAACGVDAFLNNGESLLPN